MKIKNEAGEEIDVFTVDETNEKIEQARANAAEEAINTYKRDNPDKVEEVNKLKEDLASAQKALKDAEENGDKDGQVKRLRRERDEAVAKVETVAKDISKKFDDFTNEAITELKDNLLAQLSNGNIEIRKKIELEFKNYRPDDNSKKGIQERMSVAAQIVTGNKPKPSFLDSISLGGDRGNGGNYNSKNTDINPTPNQLAIGKVLGITQKDREDYKKFKESRGY